MPALKTASDFIRQHHSGVLSTHSLTYPGYPFGSVVPYMISDDGKLVIYISELAEHTKNIQADPKVSLTIADERDETNQMSGARMTCLATVRLSPDQDGLKQKYSQLSAEAELVASLPGFSFYDLDIEAIRLIAGFGKIDWLPPDALQLT